ncbi:unnamed protein product [Ilex paraguariensis]|uniref:Uncharacterized protein n=1 Tax=Ilex paraguariensis TaxID=185542 RepID=A0ABC8TQF2_9AQUA
MEDTRKGLTCKLDGDEKLRGVMLHMFRERGGVRERVPISDFRNGTKIENDGLVFSVIICSSLSFDATWRADGGKIKTKGTIFLSNIRMVFVANKPVENFTAFDMPLLYVHGEKFNQPIFFCNNISGNVEPVVPDDHHRALYSTQSFKILFKEGGCGTFVPLFFALLASVREYNRQTGSGPEPRSDPLQAAQTPVDEMMRHAYVDPNDPTRIFLQQPTSESQLRRRTYQSQPVDHSL